MPELSRFFGIVINMYARDYGPSNFHARYGIEQMVFLLGLDTPRLRAGIFAALGPQGECPIDSRRHCELVRAFALLRL